MPFGVFAVISLFYAVVGIRVVRDVVVHRREAFDRRFTEGDRRLVDQAAFFILVPISVALHELGHAIAIWSFGGKVSGFGYYVFAGYVSYVEPFTNAQRILVALAGPLVNVILAALALAAVFLRRTPLRAAFNELLYQFAIISVVNALVFYPILDVATGLEGDWSQMYRGGVPALSAAIFAGHAGILGFGYWAGTNDAVRRRLASLTGMPPGTERGLMGGLRLATGASPAAGSAVADLTPTERVMEQAGARVAAGWHAPVRGTIERRAGSTLLTLTWTSAGARRAVAIRLESDGSAELIGAVQAGEEGETTAPTRRRLQHWPSLPDEDTLTLALRLGLEAVDPWHATAGAPTTA